MKSHLFKPILKNGALAVWLLLAACGPSGNSGPTGEPVANTGESPVIRNGFPKLETTETQSAAAARTPEPRPRLSGKIPLEKIYKYKGMPGVVHIAWTTESEKNCFGFNIMRGKSQEGPFEKINRDPILGAGNSSTTMRYEFFDATVKVGDGYYYYNQQIDLEGNTTDHLEKGKYIVVSYLNLYKVRGNPLAEDKETTAGTAEDAPAPRGTATPY